MKKPNSKCPKCGKKFYSIVGGFHREENEKFYSGYCSKKCAKKDGLADYELEED